MYLNQANMLRPIISAHAQEKYDKIIRDVVKSKFITYFKFLEL